MLAGLALDGGMVAGVARRDVREREPFGVGLVGDRGGLAGGRVEGLPGAVVPVAGEGGVVDEQIRVFGSGDDRVGRSRVAGVDERATWARRTDDLLRFDGATLVFDGFAAVELRVLGAGWEAEVVLGRLAVETTLAVVLNERVADRLSAVVGAERADLVL